MSLWVDDLKDFAAFLKEKDYKAPYLISKGMSKEDADRLTGDVEKLKEAGWLVEVRGYTYHRSGEDFVIKTLVENLANPAGLDPGTYSVKKSKNITDEKELQTFKKKYTNPICTQVGDRVCYAFLYYARTDSNPQPGEFKVIQASYLREALKLTGGVGKEGPAAISKKGPGGEDTKPAEQKDTSRDAWRVSGKVATEVTNVVQGNNPERGPGGVGKQQPPAPRDGGLKDGKKEEDTAKKNIDRAPHTEFVIFFVWLEPLTPEATAANEQKQ